MEIEVNIDHFNKLAMEEGEAFASGGESLMELLQHGLDRANALGDTAWADHYQGMMESVSEAMMDSGDALGDAFFTVLPVDGDAIGEIALAAIGTVGAEGLVGEGVASVAGAAAESVVGEGVRGVAGVALAGAGTVAAGAVAMVGTPVLIGAGALAAGYGLYRLGHAKGKAESEDDEAAEGKSDPEGNDRLLPS